VTFFKAGSDRTDLFGTQPQVYGGHFSALLESSSNWRLSNGSWSGGGPFYVKSVNVEHHGTRGLAFKPFGVDLGTFTIGGSVLVDWDVPESIDGLPRFKTATAGMADLAVRGYKRTRPGQPEADLAQFLIELRDLPHFPFKGGLRSSNRHSIFNLRKNPALKFREIPGRLLKHVSSLKNLGSEYLNVVFGWKPLIQDLQKMYHLQKWLDKRLTKLYRENGKKITRRTTLTNTRSVTQAEAYYGYPYAGLVGQPPNFGFDGYTVVTTTTQDAVKEWYMSKYIYYILGISANKGSEWTKASTHALFGALPTPSVMYEVMPWSWLIDWFSNLGDVISNLSPNAVDNLATLYSYTMRHTRRTITASHVVYHRANGSWWREMDNEFRTVREEDVKLRTPSGNPFQVRGSNDGLTPSQAAILAALGASRGLVQ